MAKSLTLLPSEPPSPPNVVLVGEIVIEPPYEWAPLGWWTPNGLSYRPEYPPDGEALVVLDLLAGAKAMDITALDERSGRLVGGMALFGTSAHCLTLSILCVAVAVGDTDWLKAAVLHRGEPNTKFCRFRLGDFLRMAQAWLEVADLWEVQRRSHTTTLAALISPD
jgi:hypothetical protein